MVKARSIILAVITLLWIGSAVAHADSPQLDSLASQITGQPTTVECYPPDGVESGYVDGVSTAQGLTMGSVIHLAGDNCGALENAMNPTARTRHWIDSGSLLGGYLVGVAFLNLTHEAMHIRLDSLDEGLVECTALRNVWPFLTLLPYRGFSRAVIYQGALAANHELITDFPDYNGGC